MKKNPPRLIPLKIHGVNELRYGGPEADLHFRGVQEMIFAGRVESKAAAMSRRLSSRLSLP
jgi:hypothetical protein